MKQVGLFRRQARACAEMGSPMYEQLLTRMADDLDAGGVTSEVIAGHEEDSEASVLAIRLLGSVHRLVLQRRAGDLATFYPSVGGSWDLDAGWTAFTQLLAEQPDETREWLDRPPQTNEVGRSGALMGGLLHVGESFRRPVRLFEIGASGGLNLLVDRFGHVDEAGTSFGDTTSDVRLDPAWKGRPLTPWPDLDIAERAGSDVRPVEATSTEGRLTLTAYVWPDQTHRLERLRGALALAQRVPVDVRREDAVSFVGSLELHVGATTVLWHSVMWQYLAADQRESVTSRIAELGEQATDERPFAHLFLEPARRAPGSDHEFLVVLTIWPGGERRILGTSVGHGVPTTWE